jgi:hypothetical protein
MQRLLRLIAHCIEQFPCGSVSIIAGVNLLWCDKNHILMNKIIEMSAQRACSYGITLPDLLKRFAGQRPHISRSRTNPCQPQQDLHYTVTGEIINC